jgi:hypothetical protein
VVDHSQAVVVDHPQAVVVDQWWVLLVVEIRIKGSKARITLKERMKTAGRVGRVGRVGRKNWRRMDR